MRKLLLLLVLLSGCTDAERARTFSLGQVHHIKCFSANEVIYEGDSTGQVQHGEAGYNFVDAVGTRSYFRKNHKTGNEDVIGHGSEIVREILVCKEYYDEAMKSGFQPQVVRSKD